MRSLFSVLLAAVLVSCATPPPNREPVLGKVVLELFVDEHGKAKEIKVVEASDLRYSNAAIRAVEKRTFEPRFQNQKMRLPFEFSVPPEEVPTEDARETKKG